MSLNKAGEVSATKSVPEKGFALVEVLVAFSILLGGFSLYLWQLRQQSRSQADLYRRQIALEAAKSDLESLQGLSRDLIRDTSYFVAVSEKLRLRLNRKLGDTVMGSPSLFPKEVQVTVYPDSSEAAFGQVFEPLFAWMDGSEAGEPETQPLVRLTQRIPEYQW